MTQRPKNKYLLFSILVSIVSITSTIIINRQIANAYLTADGKTKALFGLIEYLQFGYQFYILILGILALILAAIGIKGNNQAGKKVTAFLLSLFAIAIVFIKIWRLLI
jgi:hypothetical protein